jgi:hypothetical protein
MIRTMNNNLNHLVFVLVLALLISGALFCFIGLCAGK